MATIDETTVLLTYRDVAERLRLAPGTVHRMMKAGELPSVVIGRNTRRMRESDLAAYIAERLDRSP